MTNVELKDNVVTAVKIAEEDRMNVLPSVFGDRFMSAESAIYTFMERLSCNYHGGYWEFMALSNGGLFMYPAGEKDLRITVNGNYFDDTMSKQTAGIIACLFTYSHLSFNDDSGKFADLYHLLLEYADGLDEAGKVFSAID